MKQVAAEDKVPLSQKIAYSSAAPIDWWSVGLATGVLWMPIWNIAYGVSPAILGIILLIYRGWDAIADPVMGNISDNTRTRWGRRRPYIFVGAIFTALLVPVLWNPPEFVQNWTPNLPFLGVDHQISGLVIYLTVVGLLLFTAFTVWAMPYYSLMLEMTPDYDERTHVAGYRAAVTKLGVFVGGWVLAIASLDYFIDPATGEPDVKAGMGMVSYGLAALVLILGILPAIFVKERYYKKEAAQQEKVPFWKGVKETIKIKPFWLLCGFIFLFMFGNGVVSKLGIYLNIYLINDGELQKSFIIEGWKATVSATVGICTIPIWTWICEKFDKKWAMFIILISGFIGAGLNYVCLQPAYPYLQLVPVAFNAGVLGAMWLIVPSMQADIVDYDERTTHQRREGSINSIFSWFLKMAFTLSAGVSGFIIEATGFDVNVGSEQPPEVLTRMLLFFVLIPLAFWGVSAWLMWIYPLNREKMHAIRTELEDRRGKL
ncbi:MFS transporter [Cerasicoccus maritimus]|uniref:MFS transporter n=1 Tax=Cerasicoccus maritimus TaxID=490089 RepID=UPI002852579C|nr:MFS transporter [Cerasicoccus maritimus]